MAKRHEGKHSSQCSICKHPEKENIERLWCAGRSGRSLGQEFDLHHTSVVNHARYYGLELDLERALEAILTAAVDGLDEKGATAAHGNEAIKSMAKLQGRWVDRTELMPTGWGDKSDDEYEFYALNGRFPQPGELETVQ